jgi:8-oxo-dGTP pyrophosphatase MutT (NUDIX family)
VPAPARALAFYVAAIRETFEEVGVLLARPGGAGAAVTEAVPARRLREARADLRDGRLPFGEWLRRMNLRPAVESLVYFAHWVTPVGRPKRFDTRFFLARVDDDPVVEPDQKEIVGYRWIAPGDAVEAYEQKTMQMVNATVKNLELLAGFNSVGEARDALRQRPVSAIRPKLVPLPDGGVRILHPWDPEYDS